MNINKFYETRLQDQIKPLKLRLEASNFMLAEVRKDRYGRREK